MRPGILSVRSINQYRRRDILAYVGLRYYLENSLALNDKWINEVSTHLVRTRPSPVYFRSFHFKEANKEGAVTYRNIYIPGPNEILAETALLHQCALDPAFRSAECVFSYQFDESVGNKDGVFRNYFPGLHERNKAVAKACKETANTTVKYTDIKKFYPNISKELALEAWVRACSKSSISPEWIEIGERLLTDHAITATVFNEGRGLLTGPMFSHLIANLVLAPIDEIMIEKAKVHYSRYVDDVILVGSDEGVRSGRELLNQLLEDRGLQLHASEKDFSIGSAQWIEGERDFDGSASKSWNYLIGNIKKFLVVNTEERYYLLKAFSDNGINIPLLDYSVAVAEKTYLEQLRSWLSRYEWLSYRIRAITISTLVQQALDCRKNYEDKMSKILDGFAGVTGYERKRLVPKIRYFAGRLTFLSTPEYLRPLASVLSSIPELLLYSKVMEAICSREITPVLDFGTNAVQSAAQILRIQGEPVGFSLQQENEVQQQGVAIMRLNGVKLVPSNISGDSHHSESNLLNQFALGIRSQELMKADDLFIREIACLRGVQDPLRHQSLLDIAFDGDEYLAFDIIDQVRGSS